jgi:hypothetical protein
MRSSSLSARRNGWPEGRIDAAPARARTIYDGRFDLFGIASVMQFAERNRPVVRRRASLQRRPAYERNIEPSQRGCQRDDGVLLYGEPFILGAVSEGGGGEPMPEAGLKGGGGGGRVKFCGGGFWPPLRR